MYRLATSFLLLQSLAPLAFSQGISPYVGAGPISHPGYLETKAISLDTLPTEAEAARLGLQINWLKTTESYLPYVGDPGAILWPDRVEQVAQVTVKSGKRTIATIDANQRNVDYSKYGFFNPIEGDKPALLGIEGARKVAETIAADYKLLGRPVTVEEVVAPKTYLCVVSDRGGVEMFDAETGQVVWKTSIGDGTLPIVGPAVNNEMVSLLNGADAVILSKNDGKLIARSRLDASASAMPIAVGNMLFVPQVNGTLATYDKNDLINTQASLRFSDAMLYPPVASADGTFVVWAIGNFLYTAKFDLRLELWSRLETLSPIVGSPVVLDDGFMVATEDGTVLRLNLERYNNIAWRENVGFPILTRPISNGDVVLVTSATGEVICLDAKTGSLLWDVHIPGADRPLSLSKTTAYYQDPTGGLIAVSLNDGKVKGRIIKALAKGIRNEYSDRIYLRGRDGRLMSLRESDAAQPYFHPLVQVMRGAKPASSDKTTTPPAEPQPESTEPLPTNEDEMNPFGGEDGALGDSNVEENPFGAGGDAANPFGGATDESNPFGN